MALMSQEYETIDLFRNDGKGSFHRETVYSAGDPPFGSRGIEMVDLDQDADIDILYANGDLHDSHYIKPYHSVQSIENSGEMGWQHQLLANMPGVFRALPADMGGDGDFDIVASSFVPDFVANAYEGLSLASLIWLEQTAPGEFVQHVLEVGATNHAPVELGDFDVDGDIDIAVGEFQEQSSVAVSIWWNES
jgi:hypothetical protein